MAVLIPSVVDVCLRELLAHHSPDFLLTVKQKTSLEFHIPCISLFPSPFFFLPPSALPKFRNQWGLTVMHMNNSMSHNRATNPHCGSGDSLSYTSNKSKLPVNTITVSSSANKLNPTPCQIQRGSVNLRVCCVNACACSWVYVCVIVGIRVFVCLQAVCMNL